MSWARLWRASAAAVPLITLEEARAQLRVDHFEEDQLLARLVDAVTAAISGPHGIGRALLAEAWELRLDAFPLGAITVPLGPVQVVTSIAYLDPQGASQALPTSAYIVAHQRDLAVITPAYGGSWPPTRPQLDAVTISFVAGYGDAPEDVPADLRHAAFLLLGHFYENREASVLGVSAMELPHGYTSLVERYRVGRFGA